MKEHDYLQSSLKFSVVIPAFNEEENLEVLYTRLTKVMEGLGFRQKVILLCKHGKDAGKGLVAVEMRNPGSKATLMRHYL